jgi:hypothetical protein
MQQPPLLITASLDVGKTPFVALSATSDRIEAHMQGLLSWLRDPSIERVVFAKNCEARIRSEVLVETARNYGKELEFVQVSGSKRTMILGKGYGEGDLIRQALEKSDLLKGAHDFIKVTGKLFCPGARGIFSGEGEGEFFVSREFSAQSINAIRKKLSPLYGSKRGSEALGFLKRRMKIPWGIVASAPGGLVDTRLYRVNKAFYLRSLGQSYRRVQDALGYTLERAFYDDLMGHTSSLRILEISPVIIGTSGSLGTTAGEFPEVICAEARDLVAQLVD